MNTRTARHAAAFLALASVLTPACSSDSAQTTRSTSTPARSSDWNAPTTYRFATLSLADAPKIETVFRRADLLYRRTSDKPLTYELTGLRSASDVARLNAELARAADIPFETATLTFGGLDPAASAYTNAEVKVSPGAEAFVADGDSTAPWRRVFVDKNGSWRGLVNTRGTVKAKGGWLYVAATKDGYTRYSRVNIATRSAESLSFVRFKDSNLPEPGRNATRTAESESRGFKWPWE